MYKLRKEFVKLSGGGVIEIKEFTRLEEVEFYSLTDNQNKISLLFPDIELTVEDVREIWKAIDRVNEPIRFPASEESFEVTIEEIIAGFMEKGILPHELYEKYSTSQIFYWSHQLQNLNKKLYSDKKNTTENINEILSRVKNLERKELGTRDVPPPPERGGRI